MAKQTFFNGALRDARGERETFFAGAISQEDEAAVAVTITSDMWDRGQSVPIPQKIEVVSYR